MSGTWDRLEEIVAEVSDYGTVGVSVVGPTGESWSHNGDRLFLAASTVKIPIMVEVYRQIDAGRLSLDDKHQITERDHTPGSGVLRHMRPGVEITVYDLVYLMMAISDNVATNVLIEKVGMDAVNATMRDLGMTRSNLSRVMRGRPAEPDEQENHATPNDYVRAVGAILDGKAASAESCEAMTAMLETQQNRRRLARHLPVSNKIRWGSKTGTNPGVANDAGFVLAPNGRLLIAVYTENFPDTHTAEEVIGDIARAAYADSGVVGPLYTS